MAIYTVGKLNSDLDNEKIAYIADTYLDIKAKERDFISSKEFTNINDFHMGKLDLCFNETIRSLKTTFQKLILIYRAKN
ncbi:hypothetical protein SAMN02745664_101253 [Moraxella cuniculi DSM 21768]|uniref:Uncharacterized protein n=1 Tax=Moraxella cuniculi DSM 21768 TaxID=1122245 RepID=A0A1N7DGU8_9GAMM|nr:hypothetical protein [Moraxella cuniculi]OOS08048.1 hypothetical protein B0189_01560 [Moraxella cuniculi]SIR74987.1 hypothetical protein SAMN02745664_101253 [Moraxella cuniculi DSM 21768]